MTVRETLRESVPSCMEAMEAWNGLDLKEEEVNSALTLPYLGDTRRALTSLTLIVHLCQMDQMIPVICHAGESSGLGCPWCTEGTPSTPLLSILPTPSSL